MGNRNYCLFLSDWCCFQFVSTRRVYVEGNISHSCSRYYVYAKAAKCQHRAALWWSVCRLDWMMRWGIGYVNQWGRILVVVSLVREKCPYILVVRCILRLLSLSVLLLGAVSCLSAFALRAMYVLYVCLPRSRCGRRRSWPAEISYVLRGAGTHHWRETGIVFALVYASCRQRGVDWTCCRTWKNRGNCARCHAMPSGLVVL